jgi:hypothetical protein
MLGATGSQSNSQRHPQPNRSNKSPPSPQLEAPGDTDKAVMEIIRLTGSSPKAALMLLASEIEKRVRELLAATVGNKI